MATKDMEHQGCHFSDYCSSFYFPIDSNLDQIDTKVLSKAIEIYSDLQQ